MTIRPVGSTVRALLGLSLLATVAASGQVWSLPAGEEQPDGNVVPGSRLPIETGVVRATLPDGRKVMMETTRLWKAICSNRAPMTMADLARMEITHAQDLADPARIIVIDSPRPEGPGGLNVVFQLGASTPAAAVPAFTAAEAYLEATFNADPMTITIPVSFAALPSGVIGGTSSSYGTLSWADTRSTLVGGMDGTDTIQSSLPSGTTIPVRYSTSSTTNETQVYWTFAAFKANGGSVSGNDATMQYSTAFPFDMDPSNGVSTNTISLQDVIIHEVGHALGFGSGVDFLNRDIELLDVFRFRRTDGTGDFNPDTTAEFGVRPRWAVRNNPNDDVNFDIISTEIRFSDGSPWQASHWREQTPAIGIMDPAFDYGQTFYPNFLRTTDITGFDAIGYNK